MGSDGKSLIALLGEVIKGQADGTTLWAIGSQVVYALAVFVVGFICWRLLRRLIRSKLSGSLSEVSLFETFVKAAVGVAVLAATLKPVLGIDASGLVTTLGVGSVVVSFGLQDTVANVAAGILLMTHRLLSVGDHIMVGDYRGEVIDVTWRETTIKDYNGDTEIIPNSLINKNTLVRLTPDNGLRHIFEVEIRHDVDLDAVASEICAKADAALDALGIRAEGKPTLVFFIGSTAYGTLASIRIYLTDETCYTPGRDAVMHAIQGSPWLADCLNEEGAGTNGRR